MEAAEAVEVADPKAVAAVEAVEPKAVAAVEVVASRAAGPHRAADSRAGSAVVAPRERKAVAPQRKAAAGSRGLLLSKAGKSHRASGRTA